MPQEVFTSCPEIAATIEGAPNMVAIPAVTPIIKPQETLPVKKPIPVAMMAKAAKVLPALPVTTFKALHIDLEKVLILVSYFSSATSPLAKDFICSQ